MFIIIIIIIMSICLEKIKFDLKIKPCHAIQLNSKNFQNCLSRNNKRNKRMNQNDDQNLKLKKIH